MSRLDFPGIYVVVDEDALLLSKINKYFRVKEMFAWEEAMA